MWEPVPVEVDPVALLLRDQPHRLDMLAKDLAKVVVLALDDATHGGTTTVTWIVVEVPGIAPVLREGAFLSKHQRPTDFKAIGGHPGNPGGALEPIIASKAVRPWPTGIWEASRPALATFGAASTAWACCCCC